MITKYKFYSLFIALFVMQGLNAQSLDAVFQSVMSNNRSLKTEQERNNSAKLYAGTGIAPANPEVEYGFFPGNTDAIGNKQVFGITQSIDFPTTYAYKNKIAEQTGLILDENYRLLMQDILLESWQAYVQGVYYNQYLKILNGRSDKAKQMLSFYQKKQANGDATQLEVNKARLFLINIQNRERLTAGKIRQNNEWLRELNGGSDISFNDDVFSNNPLEAWEVLWQKVDSLHPSLKQMEHQNNSAAYTHKLNRANGLPQIMVGYEREQVMNDVYGGVKAGLTIPLWQNKNQVKYAKANMDFVQAEWDNVKLKLEIDYHRRYIETEVLYGNLTELKTSLTEMNNEYLLSRSLELGQISIIEYFWEMDYFYLIEDNYLEIELSYQMAFARLYQYSL